MQKWGLYLLAAVVFTAAVIGNILYVTAVLESNLPGWMKFVLI